MSNELKFIASNRGDWSVGIRGFDIGIRVIIEDSDKEYYEEIKTDLDLALEEALNKVMMGFYEAKVTSELQRNKHEEDWMDSDD